MAEVGMVQLRVETTQEVAAWYENLPATEKAAALDTGLELVQEMDRERQRQPQQLPLTTAYMLVFGEYTALARAHARADRRLRELEAEEDELRTEVDRLRGHQPTSTSPPLTPSPLLVPIGLITVSMTHHQKERLCLPTPDEVEKQEVVGRALAYACAAAVVAEVQDWNQGLARLVSRLRGRCAALSYELWTKEYDIRVIQLHINAFRAEIAFFTGDQRKSGGGATH